MDLKKFAKLFKKGKMKLLGYGRHKETYLHVGTNFVYKRPRPRCLHAKLWGDNPTPCFLQKCAKDASGSYAADSIAAEVRTFKAWKKGALKNKSLARCRQLKDGWSIMEKIETPKDLYEDLAKKYQIEKKNAAWGYVEHVWVFPQELKWLHSTTDGWQIGYNKRGVLVEYDYTGYM